MPSADDVAPAQFHYFGDCKNAMLILVFTSSSTPSFTATESTCSRVAAAGLGAIAP